MSKTTTRSFVRRAAATTFAGALLLGFAGCKSNSPAPIVNGSVANGDPADANLAQPYTGGTTGGYTTASTQVMGQSQAYQPQQSGEAYYDQQNAAPIVRQSPDGSVPQGQAYADAEEAGEAAIADTDQAPPPLPEYDQPPAPDPNYLWTPGYWNYGQAGYYWVPGAWVAPPYYGALWTPPWWGWYNGHYWFHRGYWGPHVGYYGGINYGFGYIGLGYFGGYWRGHDFLYNRAVTNINPGMIHGYYDRPVVYNGVHYGPRPTDRVSYNGGRGGINVQPRPAELAAMREAHYPPVAAQRELRTAAAANRGQIYRADGGRPAMAFASHPVGARSNIADAPREQPFNHPGAAAQPGRPGAPAEHGFAGNPGARPGFEGARPGTEANHSNAPGARPGIEPNRPGAVAGNPGARPGFEANRPGARPGFEANRPGAPAARPGAEAARPAPTARPGFAGSPAGRPGFEAGRPATQPQRPAFTGQRPAEPMNRAAPISRPAEPMNRPAPEQRPAFTPRAPAAPREAPAARPAPAPREAPAARPAPAPREAPAPRGGGKDDRHH